MSALYIVASLWVEKARVTEFEAYERKAARIMKRYGGSIERTVRPSLPGAASDPPFEVHLVRFPSQESFDAYRADEELQALASERDAAIAKTVVLIGTEGAAYAS